MLTALTAVNVPNQVGTRTTGTLAGSPDAIDSGSPSRPEPNPEPHSFEETFSSTVMASEVAREGATVFAEKRPPVWKGR
jgi:hypothetical protein